MGVALDAEVLYGLPKGVFMGSTRAPPKSHEKNLDRKLMSTYFYIMHVSNHRKRKKNYPT